MMRKLLFRLNQVMRRVRLPALPERLQEFLPEARRRSKPGTTIVESAGQERVRHERNPIRSQ